MREGRQPLEQPKTEAYLRAFLDYMVNMHGNRVVLIVRDWLKDKL